MSASSAESMEREERRRATRYSGIFLSISIMAAVAIWHSVHSSILLKVYPFTRERQQLKEKQYPMLFDPEYVRTFETNSATLWQVEDIGLLIILVVVIWAVAGAVSHPEYFVKYMAEEEEEEIEQAGGEYTKESEWCL